MYNPKRICVVLALKIARKFGLKVDIGVIGTIGLVTVKFSGKKKNLHSATCHYYSFTMLITIRQLLAKNELIEYYWTNTMYYAIK